MANGFERGSQRAGWTTRWLPVLAYVALIFVISAQAGFHVPGEFHFGDKVAHVLEYGGLGWLGYRAARDTWPHASFARRALFVVIAMSALGVCDELFQSGIPGRDSNALDWSADTLGVSFAQWLGRALDRRRGVA